MSRCTLFAVAALAVALPALGQEPPTYKELPKSLNRSAHAKLIAALAKKEPFNNKEVRAVSVTEDWGPFKPDNNYILVQELHAAVAVFDPANPKCWLWSHVWFHRQKGLSQVVYMYGLPDYKRVLEIPCSKAKG